MAERALVAICGRARLRQRAHSADGAVLGAPGPVVAGVARARQGSARAPPARVRGLDVVPRTISRSNAFRTHVLRFIMKKSSVMGQFFEFLRQEKKFWLVPIVVIFVAFGLLMVFAQSSAVAPFIYTLF